MNSTELLGRFRSDVVDEAAPFLWSDEEIYDNIDDAQKMFCRLTGGLPDATTVATTRIPYVAGDEWVTTHSSILKIREAYRLSDGRQIGIWNYEDLPARGLRLDSRTGILQSLVIGMEPNKVRLLPIPSIADTIRLLVDRMPIKRITDVGEQTLEIAEQHHLHLLLWVKHLAYNKQDDETYDKKKADEYESRFNAYCVQAKAEKDRAKHKTRVVLYGGL